MFFFSSSLSHFPPIRFLFYLFLPFLFVRYVYSRKFYFSYAGWILKTEKKNHKKEYGIGDEIAAIFTGETVW